MTFQYNISLKPFHTFGIDVHAREFARFDSEDALREALSAASSDRGMILGGGSNVLFSRDFDGLVLVNEIAGIRVVDEDEDYVYVEAGAGENWHGFVQHCIAQDWGGVENLSLIPGCVGASPMQNIGAYGVELKEVFEELEAFHLADGSIARFSANDCAFGYRDSIFKGKYRGQFVILRVTFRLRKQPVFNTSYGSVEQELERMGVTTLSLRAVSDAVIRIRSSKLPDPAKIGNAGSFFKNPVVPTEQYERILAAHPGLPAYPAENGTVKLAAGWLIEQCGWKGYRKGDAGVHDRQALVLVNYGHATGAEIFDLSEEILVSVRGKFGVDLEREVNVV